MVIRTFASAVVGIVLVLFVALSNVAGAPQRAVAEQQLTAAYQLGLAASDICGGDVHHHDSCPLCRLDDQITRPDQTAPNVGLIVAVSLEMPCDNTASLLRRLDAKAQPRAPPHVG